MSIAFRVLGGPGEDNALFVTVSSGQTVDRLLFDCGEGCLRGVPFGEILNLDHLFFSHFHMDHVAGFESFFRGTFDRSTQENHIWGPPGTGEILHHRFRGYMWNLIAGRQAAWHVHDIYPDRVATVRCELAEAFATAHAAGERASTGPIVTGRGCTVEAILLDHGTPSAGYIVREPERVNVAAERLAELGLAPGPWLKQIREPPIDPNAIVTVAGRPRPVRELRKELLTVTPGESLAYLTDFLLDDATRERLVPLLHGVTTLICESQYRPADADLAVRNKHLTCTQVADLARRANVGRLILFHVSDRYRPAELSDLLREAQAIFPATSFPDRWNLPT